MSAPKTRPTGKDVRAFLEAVEHPVRRADGLRLLEIMTEETGQPAELWGPSIVGFGRYGLRYADGSVKDWMCTGFSPRKASMSLYIMSGFREYGDLLARLGKHKTGASCLYVNKLADVDEAVLRELVRRSVAHVKGRSAEGGSPA